MNRYGYISSWKEIPDGAKVIEDTYNEIYVVGTEDNKRTLTVVDFQIRPKNWKRDKRLGKVITINFDPNCAYDQPWLRLT